MATILSQSFHQVDRAEIPCCAVCQNIDPRENVFLQSRLKECPDSGISSYKMPGVILAVHKSLEVCAK
eukprot:6488458-Amphidinium_carterae.1